MFSREMTAAFSDCVKNKRISNSQLNKDDGDILAFACIWAFMTSFFQTIMINTADLSHSNSNLSDFGCSWRPQGHTVAKTSVPFISQRYGTMLIEFDVLLISVRLINLIFILSRPISIQRREVYLGNFVSWKKWGGAEKNGVGRFLAFGHLQTNFFQNLVRWWTRLKPFNLCMIISISLIPV